MSVESYLTRQLNIRFIDARALCNDAKLSLGVQGYHSEDQQAPLIDEAVRLFQQRPEHVKATMTRLRCELDTIKNPPSRSQSGRSDDSQRSSSSDYASAADVNHDDTDEDNTWAPDSKKRGSRTKSLWLARRR